MLEHKSKRLRFLLRLLNNLQKNLMLFLKRLKNITDKVKNKRIKGMVKKYLLRLLGKR